MNTLISLWLVTFAFATSVFGAGSRVMRAEGDGNSTSDNGNFGDDPFDGSGGIVLF